MNLLPLFSYPFWISISILFIVYLGYPILLRIISIFYQDNIKTHEGIYPNVSIVISAFNEESVITEKITNSLAIEYPKEKLEIIVVSDGSTDKTNAIMENLSDLHKTVTFISLPENAGKTNAINTAMETVSNSISLFTDANVMLEPQSVKELVKNFADKSIGCVCGQLNYISQEETGTSKSGGLYWKYEELIKKYESLTGSTMGADGSIFAIRTELFQPLKTFLIDDFSTSMNILFSGHRIVFEENAKAFEKHTTELQEELKRRKRIANRVYTAIIFFKKELLSLNLLNFLKFTFHKYFRYQAGFFMLIALVANVALSFESELYMLILILQLVFYLAVSIGYLLNKKELTPKLFYIPFYFVAMNWKQMAGIIDSIRGKRQVKWEAAKSSR